MKVGDIVYFSRSKVESGRIVAMKPNEFVIDGGDSYRYPLEVFATRAEALIDFATSQRKGARNYRKSATESLEKAFDLEQQAIDALAEANSILRKSVAKD